MKNIPVLLIIILLLASCHTKTAAPEKAKTDTLLIATIKDSGSIINDTHYFWASEITQTGIAINKNRPALQDSLSIPLVIAMLNKAYPEIILQLDKKSGDTLFIRIPHSNYLTRAMGTSGAEAYIAEATFDLTEIEGIVNVHYDFKAGDHAEPGTFSRTNFVKYITH